MMWNSVIRSTSVGPSLRLNTAIIHRCAQVHIYCIHSKFSGEARVLQPSVAMCTAT
jgi:hypothetical protein